MWHCVLDKTQNTIKVVENYKALQVAFSAQEIHKATEEIDKDFQNAGRGNGGPYTLIFVDLE